MCGSEWVLVYALLCSLSPPRLWNRQLGMSLCSVSTLPCHYCSLIPSVYCSSPKLCASLSFLGGVWCGIKTTGQCFSSLSHKWRETHPLPSQAELPQLMGRALTNISAQVAPENKVYPSWEAVVSRWGRSSATPTC